MIRNANRMTSAWIALAGWALLVAPAAAPADDNSILIAQASPAGKPATKTVPIDTRLFGTWKDGRQTHTFMGADTSRAKYVLKPFGQRATAHELLPTDKDRVYKLKTATPGSTGIFLFFAFGGDDNEVNVQRFDGKKYVAYGTWTKATADVQGTAKAGP